MTYLSGVPDVSKNDGEKAINKVIAQLNNVQDQKLQDTIYTTTLQVLKTQKNEVRCFHNLTKLLLFWIFIFTYLLWSCCKIYYFYVETMVQH